MSDERYFVPGDLDALRRENELLALENAFLKRRIGRLEQALAEHAVPAPPPGANADGPDAE